LKVERPIPEFPFRQPNEDCPDFNGDSKTTLSLRKAQKTLISVVARGKPSHMREFIPFL
jgi:hypothetical protein